MRDVRRGLLLAVGWGCLLNAGAGRSPAMAAPKDPPDPALQSYLSANGMLNRGLYELAAEEYRKFLDDYDDHEKAPIAHYGLGVSLFRMKRYREAVKELVPLQDRDPFEFSAEAATVLGQARLALGAHEQAIDAFQRVLSKHRNHPLADDAAAGLAEAQYLSARYKEAIATCKRFEHRWDDSPLAARVLFFHGLSSMALHRYDDAVDRFDALLERFKGGPFTHQASLLLAECHQRKGSVREAIRQYQRVLTQKKSRYVPDALLGLSGLLQQIGEHKQAGVILDTLLEHFADSPLKPAALLQRGRVWFELDDYDKAASFFKRLTDRDDKIGSEAAYLEAKCSLRSGAFDRAADQLARSIKRFPKDDLTPQMSYDRAVALVRGEKPEAAVKALNEFLSRFAEQELAPDALQLLAATQHRRGRYEDSLKEARAFLSKYPSHPHASSVAFLAAEDDYLAHRFKKAARAYRAFLKRYPDDGQAKTATFRLGMSLFRLERFDRAQEALERVVTGDDTPDVFRPALLALGDIHFQRGAWKQAEKHLDAYLAAGLESPSADDALLKLGLSLQRQEQHARAVKVFERLIDRKDTSPQRLQGIFERGQSLLALNRMEDARAAFQRVLDEGGDTRFAPYALNHLAALAMRQKDYDAAAELYERAARTDSDGSLQADAAFQRGMGLMAAHRFEAAQQAFARFIQNHAEDPRLVEAQARRAIALSRRNQHEAAIKAINRVERESAGRLEPTLKASLQYEKAWCLKALGRKKEAARVYDMLLEEGLAGEFNAHATLELAGLLMEDKRFERAADRLRPIYESQDAQDPAVPPGVLEQITYRLGVCDFELGRWREAVEVFDRFIERFARSDMLASAHFYAGEASYRLDRLGPAVNHLTRVVEQFKDDPVYGPGLLRLGDALASSRKWAKSERVLTDYLERFADSDSWYQAQFGVGWAREHQKRYAEAISAYRAVVSRHQGPTAARAQFQIGECLFAQKQYEPAARELLKVDILYAYPEWSAAALFEAGRCFEQLGKLAEARSQFKQVTSKYGDLKWARMATQRLSALSRSGLPGR